MPYVRRPVLIVRRRVIQTSRPPFRIVRGLGDFSTVASTIQTVEGWFPGSVSYRNNNPGNLKYANQPGATGEDANGFAIFPDYQTGLQALDNQIALDASRGLTIAQFTAKYAPAQDSNNPASYAATIASATGLSVNDPLSATNVPSSPVDLSSLDMTVASDNTGLYWGALGIAAALALVLFA